MAIDNLYAELGLDFRPDERKLFLQEMAAVARDYKSSLGPTDTVRSLQEADDLSQHFERLMKTLEESTATFSPVCDIVRLRKKHFADHSLKVPARITDLMRRFDFYLLHVPITLVAKAGWAFIQLDCIIEFNPGRSPAERPVAYQVFPQEEWQDVIRASQGLAVGLDENLEFKVDIGRLEVELPELSAEARAKVGTRAAGKAGLILGPFNYRIRRPKIISRGRGNVQVYWRLESEEHFEEEEPQLGVVLQVPKEVSRVDVIGVLKACRDFHTFTANVRHLLRYLTDRTRNFFELGAPITDELRLTDVTAGL
jgi:hypothetical protein